MARVLVAVLSGLVLASWTEVAYAQITPSNYPVIATMDGPSTAVSGQEITYSVHYRLLDLSKVASADLGIQYPAHATLTAGGKVVSGPWHGSSEPKAGEWFWTGLGSAAEPRGTVSVSVRINQNFVGRVKATCYILYPGGNFPADGCSIETQVYAPGTLPTSGTGPPDDSIAGVIEGLALLGTALLAAGAAASLRRSLAPGP